jgi:hypothetical protein
MFRKLMRMWTVVALSVVAVLLLVNVAAETSGVVSVALSRRGKPVSLAIWVGEGSQPSPYFALMPVQAMKRPYSSAVLTTLTVFTGFALATQRDQDRKLLPPHVPTCATLCYHPRRGRPRRLESSQ